MPLARYRVPGGVLEIVAEDETVIAAHWVNESAGGSRIPWLRTAVDEYCNGRLDALDELHVRMEGTPMRVRTWEAMRAITPGTVQAYGGLAARAGFPRAARAVGTACALNPIALIVPCHRVVAAHGLGGYAFGLSIKRALLEHEGVDADRLQPV